MTKNDVRKTVMAGTMLLVLPTLASGQLRPEERAQVRAQKQQRVLSARQELMRRGAELGFGTKDTFEPKATMTDERGRVHVRFARYYEGVRVLGASVKLAAGADGSVDVTHPRRNEVKLNSVVPDVGEAAAKEIVARDLKLTVPEIEFESELVILPPLKDGAHRLAWKMKADALGMAAQGYFIDAAKGSIIRKARAAVNVEVPTNGIGYSYHRGQVVVTTHFVAAEGMYKLQDPTRGGTFVYDLEDKEHTAGFHGAHYWDANNVWGNGQDWKFGNSTNDATGQTAAVDAFNGARVTWDLLLNVFNHDGWADDGGPMRLRVHYREDKNQPYGDANFDGYFANFGDGATSDEANSAAGTTVAHELGHGVWHAVVSEELYRENEYYEARGLNEGHGDIVAAMARHYEVLANAQGNVVPTAPHGDVSMFMWRSINPWMYVADGQVGLSAYVDNGGKPMAEYEEHAQGCVYGRMFAMLAVGAPSTAEYELGPPCPATKTGAYQCLVTGQLPQGMAGLGMQDAGRLWYRATAEFSEEPTFASVREAYLTAAADLFGAGSPQYKTVMNAFRAVNVGPEATDTGNPTVDVSAPLVDDLEQTAYVEATGWDDIGVRSLKFDIGGSSKTSPRGEFKGYLDLSGTKYGESTLAVTAYDALGKEGHANRSLKYKGANYLISNRGFENKSEWSVTDNSLIIQNHPVGAFLGSGYVSFSGNNFIKQKFNAPEAASYCTIGYRVRVKPGTSPSGLLRIDLMQPNGLAVEQFVNMIVANTDTADPASNNYKSFSHKVNNCGGRDQWLRLQSEQAADDGFRVDNVYVTYTAPVTAQFEATADATEGSVILHVKNIQNVDWTQIKEVRFTGGAGETLVKTYLPYIVIRPASEFATGVPYNVSASIIDWVDDPMLTIGPNQFVVSNVNQLFTNPGFENGLTSWATSGQAIQCGYNPASGEGPAAFMGTGCLYFDGSGSAEQDITVPAGGGTAKMSFRLKIDRGSDKDSLRVTAQNAGGGPVTELGVIKGDTNTKEGVSHMNYQKIVYDLTPFKGKTVRIRFAAAQSATPMLYFIDNVGASYTGPLVLF